MLLVVGVVAGGLYVISHRPPARDSRNDDMFAQVAALARAEKSAELVQRAIRDHRAIVGMTLREVEKAKGPPAEKQRAESLSAADRALGGAERWIYRDAAGESSRVLFDAGGRVIASSDVRDDPSARPLHR